MTFQVGQKVVCIDARQPKLSGSDHRLVKGAVYTVTAVGLTHLLDPQQLPCITVAELPDHSLGVWQHRFRPAVERKTDISVFKEMLTPQGVEA